MFNAFKFWLLSFKSPIVETWIHSPLEYTVISRSTHTNDFRTMCILWNLEILLLSEISCLKKNTITLCTFVCASQPHSISQGWWISIRRIFIRNSQFRSDFQWKPPTGNPQSRGGYLALQILLFNIIPVNLSNGFSDIEKLIVKSIMFV